MDRSESARIAELGSGHRLLVFGFWTGRLPEIARLHFLTAARELPAGSRYVLLVQDAQISDPLRVVLERCNIEVVPFDLARLLAENGVGHLLRRTTLGRVWRIAKRFGRTAAFAGLGHHHATRGFTPRYNRLLDGPPASGATISDFVRVVVSSVIKTRTLYTDIDFAFARPLEWIVGQASFVYRWERYPFANSALMSVAAESPIKRGALLELLARDGSAKPWILFSDRNCQACGLQVLSCDRLDPLWSLANPSGPGFTEFFHRSGDSEERLRVLMREFDAIHWHNRWREMPEAGSPYDLWVRELAS